MCAFGKRVRDITHLYNFSYLCYKGDPHILLGICTYNQLEGSHMYREHHMDCCCRHYLLFVEKYFGQLAVSVRLSCNNNFQSSKHLAWLNKQTQKTNKLILISSFCVCVGTLISDYKLLIYNVNHSMILYSSTKISLLLSEINKEVKNSKLGRQVFYLGTCRRIEL